METFGQYAATRPLREHPMAPREAGGVIVEAGVIRTFMGVDLVTGMPVIVYTMPAPAPRFAEVYSEHLPAILERGESDGVGYVIVASAPGYAPLRPTLPEPRLHWLARCSVKTLFDAHSVGLVHRHLHPEHFYAQGDHLFIEGFGLPWADDQNPYRAPEGSGQPPADVFSWARCMNTFGKGDPARLIDSELGRLIGHCLNPKPRERPTAGELVLALEQILNPKTMVGLSADPEIGDNAPLLVSEDATERAIAEPPSGPGSPRSESAPVVTAFQAPPEIDALGVPEGLEADEPDVVVRPARVDGERPARVDGERPARADGERGVRADAAPDAHAAPARIEIVREIAPESTAPPAPGDRFEDDVLSSHVDEPEEPQSAIRIGWNNDDSWQPVRTPTPPVPSGPPLLVLLLGGLLTIVLLGGLVWFLRGNPSSPNEPTAAPTVSVPSIMTFQLDPPTRRSGRLTVVSAPAGADLKPGAVLATVPGPVLFTAPGTYHLRVAIDGYETAEVSLEIPSSNNTVILKLAER